MKPLRQAQDASPLIKGQVDVYFTYRTDGAVAPVIEDIIAMVVGMLNPIQTSAMGMDTYPMKKIRQPALFPRGYRCAANAAIFHTERSSVRCHQTDLRFGSGEGYILLSCHDIGVNAPPENFVEAVQEHQPDAVGMSAFLTTTMPMFKPTIEALAEAGLRDSVKIFVGGTPVTQEYADIVGADGYAPDASALVRKVKLQSGIE